MRTKIIKILKRIGLVLVAVIAFFFLAIGLFLLFVPISRSDEGVHNYFLRVIPIGTTWDNVIEIIDDKGWEIWQMSYEHGLRINDAAGNASIASDDEMKYGATNSNIRIVGEKSMFVELGEYYGPFHTAVFVYLAFDENDKLIEVTVRRDIDGI